MTLTGITINNLDVAHVTIAKQKPFFREVMPEVDGYRDGTINVRLSESLGRIMAYDHYFKGLRWDDNAPHLVEDFGFIKIRTLTHGGRAYSQWGYLYFPSASPNRTDKRLVELLGTDIPELHHGDPISVTIDDGYVMPV